MPAGPNSAGGRCILGFDLAVQVEDSAAWSEFNDLALVQLGDLARSRSRLSGSRGWFDSCSGDLRRGGFCVFHIDLLTRAETPGNHGAVDIQVVRGHYLIAEPQPYVRPAFLAA